MANYSEMTDFEIDVAVAKILHPGRKITNFAGEAVVWFGNLETRIVRYCKSWADAGPIIEKNRITLAFDGCVWRADSEACWVDGAEWQISGESHQNPLRTAMVVFLMMQEKA